MTKGSTFESFLVEEGTKDEVYGNAAKRVLAWKIAEAMKGQNLNKKEMAARMETSRTQLDRLLDPENDKVQFDTILKAAKAVGRSVRIEFD